MANSTKRNLLAREAHRHSSTATSLGTWTRVAALAVATSIAGFAASAPAQETISASPDITIALSAGTLVVADEDVVVDNQLGIVLLENLGSLPTQAQVQGHSVAANGDRLFTLETTTSLAGGVVARPSDVIRYDGANYSIEFDGSAEGVPTGVATDAVSDAPGGLLLSFDSTVDLGGGVIAADEDLVRWDGSAFSAAFDGSAEGLSGSTDVDGAQDLGGGAFLLSLDTSGSVGGIDYADEDVLRFDGATSTWSLEFDASAADSNWAAADMNAVMVPEPSTLLGLAFGAGALVARRRRTR